MAQRLCSREYGRGRSNLESSMDTRQTSSDSFTSISAFKAVRRRCFCANFVGLRLLDISHRCCICILSGMYDSLDTCANT